MWQQVLGMPQADPVAHLAKARHSPVLKIDIAASVAACINETEYVLKKPMNRAFQRYVCRMEVLSSVFANESETLHCRRRNGNSHCENGEQNLPFPLQDVDG